MDKNEFKIFCKNEFEARGFKKQKNMFYLKGHDLLCGICLQRSYYGSIYYVNYCYFIGSFEDIKKYPSHYESDIYERLLVMYKTSTIRGKNYITSQIEYEEYTEEELRPFFDKEFEEKILPPIKQGKKYILDNLKKIYSLTINQEEVLQKLKE